MLNALFLCTGNSCSLQMAEGFAKEPGKGQLEPYRKRRRIMHEIRNL